MCFYAIAAKYNGPLDAAHAYNDDERYDTVECGTEAFSNCISHISYDVVVWLLPA